jgi:anti-sigma-K factor RskA
MAWRIAAAVAIAAIVALVYVDWRQAAETTALRKQVGREAAESAGLRAALTLLESPETREVRFGEGQPAPPRGRVFVNPSSGVLLVASNLPAPPAGKTYEMWIVPKAGKPAPAGLFASGADGTAVHVYRAPVSLADIGAIAVTLEPAGGVEAPTSQPVIAAAL